MNSSPAITASSCPRSRATWSDSTPRPRCRGRWQVASTAARSETPNGRAWPRPRSPAVRRYPASTRAVRSPAVFQRRSAARSMAFQRKTQPPDQWCFSGNRRPRSMVFQRWINGVSAAEYTIRKQTPLYVKNARGSTTARSVRGELKALASLGSRSPRTVNHGRQPAERVLRCAPALRVTAAADRAGSPCGPAGRLARDPLPGSATPASHSVVAENRRQTPEWDRVHLPDRGFAVARTIRKHAVGILAYLDTRMTERARGRTHPARPTG